MKERIRFVRMLQGGYLLNFLDEWDVEQGLKELEDFGGKSKLASLSLFEDGRLKAYIYHDENLTRTTHIYYPSQIAEVVFYNN